MSVFMRFYCTGVGCSVGAAAAVGCGAGSAAGVGAGVGAGGVVSRRASTLGIALMSLSAGGVIRSFGAKPSMRPRRNHRGNDLALRLNPHTVSL